MTDFDARINAYSIEDLQDNRAGYLTNNQKRHLVWTFGFSIASIVADLFLILLIFLTGIRAKDINAVTILPFFSLMPLISLIIGVRDIIPLYRDLREEKIKITTGRGHKYMPRGGTRGVAYFFVIRGELFAIRPKMYDWIREHQPVRVFFTPHSHQIVNIQDIQFVPRKTTSS